MSAAESKTGAMPSHRLAACLRVWRLAPAMEAGLMRGSGGAVPIANETLKVRISHTAEVSSFASA
jgi:hypothetical protein